MGDDRSRIRDTTDMIRTHGVTHYDPDACFGCKLLSVQFGEPTFEPHFNHSVGRYVTSWGDFNEALRRSGDVQSERTGIHSQYEAIHPSDLISSPPPVSAPSHLDRIPGAPDSDPTLATHADALQRERAAQKAKATTEARTKDLIHAGHE